MGIRRKLKSLLRIKCRGHRDHQPLSPPHAPGNAVTFYYHPNGPIRSEMMQPAKTHIRTGSANVEEPLEFKYKSYTTASGVVIPQDFSYDQPKNIYRVSAPSLANEWGENIETDDSEDTEVSRETTTEAVAGGNEASTDSEYSINTLYRINELALTAYQGIDDDHVVHTPRPLPEIPGGNSSTNRFPTRRRIRILTGKAMRKVHGIRIKSGGGNRSRIIRTATGGEAYSREEHPRHGRM